MAKPAAGQGASLTGAGFRRCHCGCLVLWDARTGEALTPALGEKHFCGENCQCRFVTQGEES